MGIRRGTNVSTVFALAGIWIEDELHTREAVGLRVTMMIGHTGRYLEIIRAELPLFED